MKTFSQKPLVLFVAVLLVPFTITAQEWIQQGSKLVGTGAVGNAGQGYSVSLSSDGNTAIVGASEDNSTAGAVWVWTRFGGLWAQQGSKLVSTGAVGNAAQGYSGSLSSDGNTAIVGGQNDNSQAGAAWVWTRSGGVWAQQGSKLVGTGAVGNAGQGLSVSLSSDGNTAIVGGYLDNSHAGAAWVWTRSGGVWTQQGSKLVGTGAVGIAYQGISVSISSDGNTAIVGGYTDNASAGAAWVWTRSGGVWTQQGGKLVGTGAVGNAGHGYSVSLSSDGNTAIVGGSDDNSGAGAAWVWTRSGGVWTQQGNKLVGTGAVGNASQGWSASISSDGNTAIVGGFLDNSQAGAAWVWRRLGGVWTQQGSKLVGTGATGSARQGRSVSISSDGNTAIVGGNYDNSNAGAAWVFTFSAQATISSVADIAADQGGKVRITWNKSIYDALGSAHQIASYGLWRQVPVGGVATSLAPKTLAKTLSSALATTYDFITTVPAVRFDSYAYVAPTLNDSTPSGIHRYTYIVSAHTSDPTLFYISDPDSGYSVDNLVPAAPGSPQTGLLANGPISITWNRNRTDPDVGHYTVYRSTQDGFTVGPSTQLVTSTDTTVVDSTTSIGQTYFYRVTTVDIHGNESIPTAQLGGTALAVELTSFTAVAKGNNIELIWSTSTEINNFGFEVEKNISSSWKKVGFVAGSGTTGTPKEYSFKDLKLSVGTYAYRLKRIDRDGKFSYSQSVEATISQPTIFTLEQNYPNPFNPSTVISYQLPVISKVTLKICDVLGREVATLVNEEQSAGWKEAKWHANVFSGIYYYRIEAVPANNPASSFVQVKKMLLLR